MVLDTAATRALLERAYTKIKEQREQIERLEARTDDDRIAVIGYACRFPGGATDNDRFWSVLNRDRDVISEVDDSRWSLAAHHDPTGRTQGKTYTLAAGLVDDFDRFDARFFGVPAVEAEAMDPQQRMLLETSWHALEHAGLDPFRLRGSATGVFVGLTTDDYARLHARSPLAVTTYTGLGSAKSMAAGRLAYYYDFRGPTLQLDTTCSSSLVALHLAVRELRERACDLALVGGANAIVSPDTMVSFCEMKALSRKGQLRAFDDDADGYVRGEGCGVVVLKRYADAIRDGDCVHALILGSAIAHDGRTNGLTAPNPAAQERVIRAAMRSAGVAPDDVGYVEAHGTGTKLGDLIEIGALGAAHRGRATQLRVGSVKANLGHLEAAAGMAALIKVLLGLRHGRIPGQVNFATPNSRIDWSAVPLEVSSADWPWPATSAPRRAGISAFGMSGTNVHVIVGETPVRGRPAVVRAAGPNLLMVSARSEDAMRRMLDDYARACVAADVSTLEAIVAGSHRRAHFAEYRLALPVVTDGIAAARALEACDPVSLKVASAPTEPLPALVFTGQGTAFPGMAADAYRDWPAFRDAFDLCAEVFAAETGGDLVAACCDLEQGHLLGDTSVAQPALVAMGIALHAHWASVGLRSAAVVGHSIGEYAAAVVAGSLDARQAMRLACLRGRAVAMTAGAGAMYAIVGTESALARMLAALPVGVWPAAFNAPGQITLACASDAQADCLQAVSACGAKAIRLDVAHPFHSPVLAPAATQLAAGLDGVSLRQPDVPWIGTCGVDADPQPWRRADYFVAQLTAPVGFRAAIARLSMMGITRFLEIGAVPALTPAIRACLGDTAKVFATLQRGRSGDETWHASLKAMYEQGMDLDWRRLTADRPAICRPYAFERRRYWLNLPDVVHAAANDPVAETMGFRLDDGGSGERGPRFSVAIDSQRQPHLADHRLFGRTIVAGATWIALWLQVGARLHDGGVEIRCLRFHRPLMIADGERRCIELAGTAIPGGGLKMVASVDGAMHCDCELHPLSGPIDGCVDAEPSDAATPVDLSSFYSDFASRGYTLGPAFHWMRDGVDDARGAWRRMRPPPLPADAGAYPLFPGLIDASFHALASQLAADIYLRHGEDIVIPAEIASVRFDGRAIPPMECRVAAARRGPLVGDIALRATDGRPLLDLRSLTFRKVSQSALDRRGDAAGGLHHALPQWRECATVAIGAPSVVLELGVDAEARIRVAAGPEVEVSTFDPRTTDGANALQAWIACATDRDLAIVGPAPHSKDVGAALDAIDAWRGALSALVASDTRFGRVCALIGGDGDIDPFAAAVAGALCSAAAEFPALGLQIMHGDPGDLLERLVDSQPRPIVPGEYRLHDRSWETLSLMHATTGTGVESVSVVKRPKLADGVCLIAGGSAALAPYFADWLIASGAREIVFASRSLQPRCERDADGVRRRWICCDIANLDAVAMLFERLRAEGSEVVAVVHAAGALADRPFVATTREDFATALAPKLGGAFNLARCWRSDALELVLSLSSLVSLTGSQAQAAYAGANRALDAWTRDLRRSGVPAAVLNLGPVEAGMASRMDEVHRQRLRRIGLRPLPVDALAAAAERAFATAEGQIAIYAADVAIAHLGIGSGTRNAESDARASTAGGIVETTPEAVLEALCRTMAELLGSGRAAESPDASLVELGADSLLAAELSAWIQDRYRIDMPMEAVHALPDLRSIADRVSALALGVSVAETAAQAPAMTSAWSEGEL